MSICNHSLLVCVCDIDKKKLATNVKCKNDGCKCRKDQFVSSLSKDSHKESKLFKAF